MQSMFRTIVATYLALVVGARHAAGFEDDSRQDDSQQVTVLVWNVAKQLAARDELDRHAPRCDIVCLQEYVPGILPDSVPHFDFARGFRSILSGRMSGVCTACRYAPEDAVSLRSPWREGYLFTRKSALVSRHAIGDKQLMVVNLHGMNFQPYFTFMLRSQLRQVADRIAQHPGPVIVCGDFNTWSGQRQQLVDQTLAGFRRVDFPPHRQRKTADWFVMLVGGNPTLPLDHLYARGFADNVNAQVLDTSHSDHAPLMVTLTVD